MNVPHDLGYFGNIWVRQNYLQRAGDKEHGHKHDFDHVSLLASGRVKVTVDGYPPKEFKAPTFIVIKKEHRHMFEALEDGTIWYCVFALRDVDGNVADFYGSHNSPYGEINSQDYERLKPIMQATSQYE
jgi:hypothetical protein